MSEIFTYTDKVDPVLGSDRKHSKAIECFYYNSGTKELLVGVVDSGESYLYTGVPSHVYSAFKNAVSKGYFWNKIIKAQYGPSDYFDLTDHIEFRLTGTVTALATGMPKGLTTNENTKTTPSVLSFPLKTETVDLGQALAVPASQEVKFSDANSSSVVFNMGGEDKTVDFDDCTTVSEAVAEISRIADMLGLGTNLLIKSVTVNFE